MMMDISYPGAFLWGLVSFFTPCILPLVPFYLCYLGGMSMAELRDDKGIPAGAQKRLVLGMIAFAAGVTTLFFLLGMGATALGQALRDWFDILTWIAAGVIFLFGLHFLGIIRIGFLYREAKIESSLNPATLVGAYVMGLAFGFGWTPCVGPILASILMIATGMDTVIKGGMLLIAYGVGMTLPFVFASLFSGPFLRWLQRNRGLMGHIEKVIGVMLIVFAILIATGSMNILADWMLNMFPWFLNIL
jgi:cytochrome c-type biogenesis protein